MKNKHNPTAVIVSRDAILEASPSPQPGDDLIAHAGVDWDPLPIKDTPWQDDIVYGTISGAVPQNGLGNAAGRYKPVKNRVVLASVLYPMISWTAYIHHLEFIYRCGRRNPDYEFVLAVQVRSEIDAARNRLAETALEVGAEFMYFWDTDTQMPADLMERMLEVMRLDENIVAVSPMYHIRGYPFKLMAFDESKYEPRMMTVKEVRKKADKNGLCDVYGLGCGTTMIRVSAYSAWGGPWYRTSPLHTEDAWFCSLIRKFNPKARFVIDTTMEAGHEVVDTPAIRTSNLDKMKKAFGPSGWFSQRTE